jgi:large subunit ribosomal protein L31e
MEEKKVEEEQKDEEKSEEEPEEMAETVEEEEVKEKTAEVSEKGEVAEKGGEAVEGEVAEGEAVEAKGEKVAAPVEGEEEAKPPLREEKKEAEEEIVEEKIYTVPLGRSWIGPPNRRAARAVRIVRGFVVRHMKFERGGEKEGEEEEPKRLVISNEVNERIWGRGIQKPPRKIRIRAAKDKEGNVTVYLAEGD